MPMLKLVLLSLISLMTARSAIAEDLRVLFFTMDSCPPCKQTEPGIDQLREHGIAVSKIDILQYSDYANQCQVQQTPTIMVVRGNQVLARHTGALSYADLTRMIQYSSANARETDRNTSASDAETTPTDGGYANKPAETSDNNKSWSSNGARDLKAESNRTTRPQQLAHQATVRFRVADSQGVSFATGTIIHRQGNEALVLTCGHVFRDSQGQGKINADLGFAFNQIKTVQGHLLFYDAGKHDIALVAIPCPFEIEPVRVAAEPSSIKAGDRIFSFGCDKGDDPSLRTSVLKANTTYSGVVKYDIVGRPIDGRSGGGLFLENGQLIGVCNAAAVEVDEGIYTGLQSIYWQFAQTNLTHLFRESAIPVRDALVSARSNRIESLPASAKKDELKPPVNTAIFRGNRVPTHTPIHRGNQVPIRKANQTTEVRAEQQTNGFDTGSMEMIVILRDPQNPGYSETLTVTRPDFSMVKQIRQRARAENQSNQEHSSKNAAQNRFARLPNIPPPAAKTSDMRAQSPR